MKQLFILLISASLLTACNGTKTSATEEKPATTTIVGDDADKHGCKASAGYTWSVLKNDCIRIWETGIQLSQIENNESYKTNATIIVSDDKSKVELFIATEKDGSIMLNQSGSNASTYSAKDYSLSNTNDKWLLKKGDKVIYKN
jgi:hypothetical protein